MYKYIYTYIIFIFIYFSMNDLIDYCNTIDTGWRFNVIHCIEEKIKA